MNANIKLNECIATLAVLNPASVSPSTVLTSWVPVTNFGSISAQILIGAMTATGTLDANLQQATSSAGAGAKAITGKALAQTLAAAGSNTQASIECRADDLDTNNGFGFVALSVTIGTAASIFGAALLGANPRYASAAAFNNATVLQTV
jgi:hypothetical protein